MKEYNKLQIGTRMLLGALIFGLIETAFYGWNYTPINVNERICDCISASFGMVGVIVIACGLKELFD